jgi:hypothetical protein
MIREIALYNLKPVTATTDCGKKVGLAISDKPTFHLFDLLISSFVALKIY